VELIGQAGKKNTLYFVATQFLGYTELPAVVHFSAGQVNCVISCHGGRSTMM